MSDTCDPRQTGCTAYHFPHRRESNPTQSCSRGWVKIQSDTRQYATTQGRQEYTVPLTGLVANKDIDVSIENGQLVLKQDE